MLAGAVERPIFWGGQVDSLLEAINACRYYFMGDSVPWNGREREAQALYAYLASLPLEAPETQPFSLVLSAKNLPPGDATRGEDIYRRACNFCHGAITSGEGRLDTSTPILPEEPATVFQQKYKFSAQQIRVAFIEKVRHGAFLGLYGRMPPYALETLSDDDLSALLAYLNLSP
jgi:thiosulfate dehydrogenase